MPELPEVQTVVGDLKKVITNTTISGFWSVWERSVQGGIASFKQQVLGRKIINIRRRAKFILLELDNQSVIVLHLRMTGQLLFTDKGFTSKELEKEKYIRHWWRLQKGNKEYSLLFHDLRKFGTIAWTDNLESYKSFIKLGLEPLSKSFNLIKLKRLLNCTKSVRGVLLDQTRIVGIGNIYASEILFQAGIYPGRVASSLSDKELEKLHQAIQHVLQKAIALRGTTFSDYRDSQGKIGGFQKFLKVYNRQGRRCKKEDCAGIIQKETLQQRSSFWCIVCQR